MSGTQHQMKTKMAHIIAVNHFMKLGKRKQKQARSGKLTTMYRAKGCGKFSETGLGDNKTEQSVKSLK